MKVAELTQIRNQVTSALSGSWPLWAQATLSCPLGQKYIIFLLLHVESGMVAVPWSVLLL